MLFILERGILFNLQCKSIKSGTIKMYCLNVATFVSLFDPQRRDPRYATPSSKTMAFPLTKVFLEFARWEVMPNRREPYSLAMQACLHELAKSQPPDTIAPVLWNWFLTMLQAASRRGEWAQPLGRYNLTKPDLNFKGAKIAFTLANVQFMLVGKRRCSILHALANRRVVAHYELEWDTQKNGMNGESKLFSRNHDRPDLDCVDAMLTIVDRFVRLILRLCWPFSSHRPTVSPCLSRLVKSRL
jgi:hypothetical protein